jgi:hypothetical protein
MEEAAYSPRRIAVAGGVLTAGLLFGIVLFAMFRWSPYYWQWLAYHNALVAGVIIYLLLGTSEANGAEPERPRIVPRPPVITITRRVRPREPKMAYAVQGK